MTDEPIFQRLSEKRAAFDRYAFQATVLRDLDAIPTCEEVTYG